MFACCSVCTKEDTKNEVILDDESNIRFTVRLDICVINNLIKCIERDPIIKVQLKLYIKMHWCL